MASLKLCRACLGAEGPFTFSLFDNISVEQYSFCTSVEVQKDDDLPKSICKSCHELLIQFSQFKKMCILSQNSLLERKCGNVKIEINIISPFKHECDHGTVKEEDYNDNFFCDDISEDSKPLKNDINNKGKLNDRYTKKLLKRKKRSKTKEGGKKHKLEHAGKIAPVHCLLCNKTFASSNGLKRHNVNTHTLVSLKSLQCNTCGKIFMSQDSLKLHVKSHSDIPQKIHVCDVCGKNYRDKSALKRHLKTHKENRERDYTCERCGQKFYSNASLANHVFRKHSCRRYICDMCNYPFTQKYNLIQHLLIHEGKKLYTCEICQKAFRTQGTFTEHRRTHSGERPYACTYCPKSFISRRRLNDHHLTHTGERPHKCIECNQSFSQRGTLKRHMKVHEKTNNLTISD
ncbi:zinc finger protein OZF isoform X2 [Amyelois transitella]|uniref:zinc finger protein OZF isoform X2 n=1 Tax=Amyelois transitella TaxID=680683 RepID=UPI00067D46D1|nr:zinc finger protein OZF isoform X2 [Amyelois transitella]